MGKFNIILEFVYEAGDDQYARSLTIVVSVFS